MNSHHFPFTLEDKPYLTLRENKVTSLDLGKVGKAMKILFQLSIATLILSTTVAWSSEEWEGRWELISVLKTPEAVQDMGPYFPIPLKNPQKGQALPFYLDLSSRQVVIRAHFGDRVEQGPIDLDSTSVDTPTEAPLSFRFSQMSYVEENENETASLKYSCQLPQDNRLVCNLSLQGDWQREGQEDWIGETIAQFEFQKAD